MITTEGGMEVSKDHELKGATGVLFTKGFNPTEPGGGLELI